MLTKRLDLKLNYAQEFKISRKNVLKSKFDESRKLTHGECQKKMLQMTKEKKIKDNLFMSHIHRPLRVCCVFFSVVITLYHLIR